MADSDLIDPWVYQFSGSIIGDKPEEDRPDQAPAVDRYWIDRSKPMMNQPLQSEFTLAQTNKFTRDFSQSGVHPWNYDQADHDAIQRYSNTPRSFVSKMYNHP